MKKRETLESKILGLQKAGKSWGEIEEALRKESLLQGNGSNLELFGDVKAMDGKRLKRLPEAELHRLFAQVAADGPDLKPIEVRNRVWEMEVHCYRRDYRAFLHILQRQGLSVDQFLKQEKARQELRPTPIDDQFSVRDWVTLTDLVGRNGKDKVLRILKGAF